jgi:uncharacterized damage-inducible protein DinB
MFEYHFTLNRRIWDVSISALTDAQFVQEIPYSIGSIRNHCVHLMSVDQRWFCGLMREPVPNFLNPVHYPSREKIRAYWDDVETFMRGALDTLTDDDIAQPYPSEDSEKPNLFSTGIVLSHVLNHGTDHRAQMLSALATFGAPTFPQDYFFFAIGVDTSRPRGS